MSLTPTYRTGTLADTAQIQHLLFTTWSASFAHFIPLADMQQYFTEHYTAGHFARWCEDTQVWSYVAEAQGHIVGYARAHLTRHENRLYLESLYVLPNFHGHGIGSKLLNMVEELAVQQGQQAIWLGVMVQNVPSLAWYKKLGFQFVEEAPFRMGDSTVAHLIGYRPLQQRGETSSDDTL